MTILFTGGHLTPAVATIDYLIKTKFDGQLVFIGRKFSQEKLKQPSREADEMAARNIPFYPLHAVRFGSGFIWRLPIFGWSVIQSLILLRRVQPSIVVSFGGYLAAPVVIAAWFLRIPSVTHEQTSVIGHATKLISRFAKRIAVSDPATANQLPAHKVAVTGNLLRSSFFESANRPSWLPKQLSKPILVVTGGNQGSKAINQAVFEALPKLLNDWIVIHQTGPATNTDNYLAQAEQAVQTIQSGNRDHYFYFPWLSEQDLNWLFRQHPVVICRAGANTLDELALFSLVAVIIPLPQAHQDEQLKNAQRYLKNHQPQALILPQSELTPDRLISDVTQAASARTKATTQPDQQAQTAVVKFVAEIFSVAHHD